MPGQIEYVRTAIDYMESHLYDAMTLETVAHAVHVSKYHLHRMFRETAGQTIHAYIKRRRLTEAARLLVFSKKNILETALLAGYESQQAFTDAFRAMYKKAPGRYRETGRFYPLQARFSPREQITERPKSGTWEREIRYAGAGDLSEWMRFVELVIDGFPCLEEGQYLKRLRKAVSRGRALLVKDGTAVIGAMILNGETGEIGFLGVHPQYRGRGLERALCRRALRETAGFSGVSITTFREGDKADTGYRALFKRLGFAEAELLTEFGYPTQRLILPGRTMEDLHHE